MTSLAQQPSNSSSNRESSEFQVPKSAKSPQSSKSPPSYARVASMHDSDEEKEQNKNNDEFALESSLVNNEQKTESKPSPRDILSNIYDEVLSDEEENDEEEKKTDVQNNTDTKKVPTQTKLDSTIATHTNGETAIEMVTFTKNEEKHENEHKNDDIMEKIHQHKSVLGATMDHGERLDNVFAFIDWRIIIQVVIASLLALLTFYVEFGVWRLFKISQCKEDIVYLSLNSFKYSIYEMWQNGFCFLFGDIYLITATIIDYGAAAKFGKYFINIRKLRFWLLIITMLIAFIFTFFVSFADPLLYNLRMPIFVFAVIVFYYLCLLYYRKIIIPQAYYILWPFAAYIWVIVIVYGLGLLVAWVFRGNQFGFAAVYPIYIGLAQTIGITVMKYYHYLLCCICKKKYAVSKNYDPNSYYEPQEITERYICTDDGGKVTDADTFDEKQTMVDGRAVEYLWVDEWLYFICGMMIVFTESMRISGLLAVKDNTNEVIVSCISAMIMEILQRNNLVWEFLYGVILRKSKAPDRSKFDAMYYGAKYSWEYLPILLLLFMDLMQFGPTNSNATGDCRKKELDPLYQVIFGEKSYWYIFIIILGFELITDLMCELINWSMRKCAWIPLLPKDDGARRIILIRLGVFGWTALFISAIQVSQLGYSLDFAISNMLNGEWQIVDDYADLFF